MGENGLGNGDRLGLRGRSPRRSDERSISEEEEDEAQWLERVECFCV